MSLPKVLRKGQLYGSACAGINFITINDWLGTTVALEGLWILIWFLMLKEPFLAASANAYDTDKGIASLSLRSPSFKWLIAPSTIVFIQIICS